MIEVRGLAASWAPGLTGLTSRADGVGSGLTPRVQPTPMLRQVIESIHSLRSYTQGPRFLADCQCGPPRASRSCSLFPARSPHTPQPIMVQQTLRTPGIALTSHLCVSLASSTSSLWMALLLLIQWAYLDVLGLASYLKVSCSVTLPIPATSHHAVSTGVYD